LANERFHGVLAFRNRRGAQRQSLLLPVRVFRGNTAASRNRTTEMANGEFARNSRE
jgi:hypothetical protein